MTVFLCHVIGFPYLRLLRRLRCHAEYSNINYVIALLQAFRFRQSPFSTVILSIRLLSDNSLALLYLLDICNKSFDVFLLRENHYFHPDKLKVTFRNKKRFVLFPDLYYRFNWFQQCHA